MKAEQKFNYSIDRNVCNRKNKSSSSLSNPKNFSLGWQSALFFFAPNDDETNKIDG